MPAETESLDPRVARTLDSLHVGQRFGRLRVLSLDPEFVTTGVKRVRERVALLCGCDCGRRVTVLVGSLKTGNTTSCGCYRSSQASRANLTHGATVGKQRPRLYSIWRGMQSRCNVPSSGNYRWYGGRGITICEDWNDFAKFRAWAQENGYEDFLELDRIDNDRSYCPENCRWVTKLSNLANRSGYLPEHDEDRLRAFAEETGRSVSSLIREAVGRFLDAEGR